MPMTPGAQFGIPFGEKMAPTAGPQPLLDGLTTCQFVVVKPLSTNAGDVLITARNGSGSGAFRLKPADTPVTLPVSGDNNLLLVQGTQPGTSICYFGRQGEGF